MDVALKLISIPISAGKIVQLTHFGNTSSKVDLKIFVDEINSDFRDKAVSDEFSIFAIDANKTPIKTLCQKMLLHK